MKIPELKLGQVVAVLWVDVKSNLGWSYNPKKPRTLAYIASVGYVVQKNKNLLTITTSMDERGATIDDLSIPVGCLRKIEVIPDCGFLIRKSKEESSGGVNSAVQNPDVQALLGA